MRIVHVVESINPANGGPSVSVPSLAAAQACAGNEVVLIFYEGTKSEANLAQEQIPGLSQVVLCGVNSRSPWEKFYPQSAVRVLKNVLHKADIVHLHGIWGMMLLKAAQLARTCNIKYVVSPRGMLDPWSLGQKRLKKSVALWLVWRRVLDGAFFLHVLNKAEADLVNPLRLKCPIRIFPNGIFVRSYGTDQEYSRTTSSITGFDGHPFVLFLSRVHYKKGLDLLLDAFALVASSDPMVCLVIAGPDSGFGAEVEKRIKRHNLGPRVHLVGPLYGQAKDKALARAKCFCLPSRQEGFSMAILEALSAGLPVVITDSCHFPEVEEAGAGIIVTQSPEEIAGALKAYLNNEAKRDEAGRAGQNLVSSRYQWHHIAEQMIQEYAGESRSCRAVHKPSDEHRVL